MIITIVITDQCYENSPYYATVHAIHAVASVKGSDDLLSALC